MRPYRTLAALALATVATAAYAQTVDPLPPLIRNVTIEAGDSKMVRAAKAAVAARLKIPSQARTLINDQTLRRGRFSQPSGDALPVPSIGSYSPGADSGSGSSRGATVTGAQIQQQIQNLRTEQEYLSNEADEEPYSDVDPDFTEQRLTAIPGQINAAQQRLQPPPPPPPDN